MKRSLVIGAAALITALATLLAVTRALTPWDAAALAGIAFGLWFVTRPYLRSEVAWPKDPRPERPGGRADVAQLSWTAFTRNGLVTERVLRRMRAIAARRLAVHGVLWDGRLPEYAFHDGPRNAAAAAANVRGWGTGPQDAAEHKQRARDLLGAAMVDELSTARAVTPRTLDHWFRALDALVAAPDDSRSTR